MKSENPVVIETLKAAAALLKCPLHDLRRAKAAGCLAFEPGGRIRLAPLKAWLAKHPAKARKPIDATELLPHGFNAAFERLLGAEVRAYQRMESASDDDERALSRREWAALLVEVRKHAHMAPDFGELVNRGEIEKSLRVFADYLLAGIRDEFSAVCPRLAGLPTAADVALVLDPLAEKIFSDAISRAASCAAGTAAGFPGWASAVMTK